MLVSPSLDGHRSVYAAVIAQALRQRDLEVLLWTLETPSDLPALSQIRSLGVRTVVAPEGSREIRDVRLFAQRVSTLEVDVVFFLEADLHLNLIAQQLLPGAPLIAGRRLGLFLRATRHRYARDYLGGRTGRIAGLRHHAARPALESRVFHELLVPHLRPLDAALYLDEYFVQSRPQARLWMPDIFASNFPLPEDQRSADRESLRELSAFRERQSNLPVFVYFGRAQPRRGYGEVLRLAAEAGGCFVHAGDGQESVPHDSAVDAARCSLLERGRLLETNRAIAGFDAARSFLAAGECVVLPYRNHFGSSGVMLQALNAGRPVLVPNVGLMAQRVRQHGLGLTYRHGAYDDLVRRWRDLNSTDPAHWARHIAAFLRRFTDQERDDTICRALGVEASRPTGCHGSVAPCQGPSSIQKLG